MVHAWGGSVPRGYAKQCVSSCPRHLVVRMSTEQNSIKPAGLRETATEGVRQKECLRLVRISSEALHTQVRH